MIDMKTQDMDIQTKIKDLLISTGRPGMDKLIAYMEENGYFTAPCSGGHHLAKEGGLAEHSLNVYNIMTSMRIALDLENYVESFSKIVITALLHDLGKIGDFGKPNYIINMIKDGKPTKAEPEQKYKQSEANPYKTNTDLMYTDHEIRSIKIASKFIDLTEEEENAIIWHNGLYGKFYRDIQGNETKLYMLLHWSDMWASRVVEIKESEEK